jgi:outer membrane protein OmpA-like peptidoglycan-associated protein
MISLIRGLSWKGADDRRRIALSRIFALLLVGCPIAHAADPPPTETSKPVLSEEQIERALKPATTRGLSLRGLKRTQAAEAATSVNLNVPFEYNSSELRPEASAQLKQLKSALLSEALRSDRFLVAGHTDAKGNARYNKQLSLRRAESVKRFLVANGLEASRLDIVGYGSEQLLTPDRPEDAQNRRVEIRDLGEAPSKP